MYNLKVKHNYKIRGFIFTTLTYSKVSFSFNATKTISTYPLSLQVYAILLSCFLSLHDDVRHIFPIDKLL